MLEALFDGVWIAIIGKSGVYFSIWLPHFIVSWLFGGALFFIAWYLSKISNEIVSGSSKLIPFFGMLFFIGTLFFFFAMPIISLVCDNPISCSFHPRSEKSDTWLTSPNELIEKMHSNPATQ